jgi:putative FmdB family regulatory protein
MPIYEYVCSSCGSEFEAIQKFSDAPLSECACGESGTVERKLSLAAFQLKGGGWYKDQYAPGKANAKADGNGKADSKADGSGKSKGDGAAAGDNGSSSGAGSSTPAAQATPTGTPSPASTPGT